MLLSSNSFKLDKELDAELKHQRLALTVAAAAGHADIVRALLTHCVTIPYPMMRALSYESWHPVEAAVLGHYYGTSRSLDAARAIVGDMATSLREPRNVRASFAWKDFQENLDIFLRAAAEIGQVDAVRHLLKLRHTQPQHALIESDRTDMLRYLDRRSIEMTALEKVEIHIKTPWMPQMDILGWLSMSTPEVTPFPIPVFLAAVRQHEEALALFLPGRNAGYIQGLMERARDIHLGCKDFDHFLEAHC
jgi:hypothetical protein